MEWHKLFIDSLRWHNCSYHFARLTYYTIMCMRFHKYSCHIMNWHKCFISQDHFWGDTIIPYTLATWHQVSVLFYEMPAISFDSVKWYNYFISWNEVIHSVNVVLLDLIWFWEINHFILFRWMMQPSHIELAR